MKRTRDIHLLIKLKHVVLYLIKSHKTKKKLTKVLKPLTEETEILNIADKKTSRDPITEP